MTIGEDVLDTFRALGFSDPIPEIILDLYSEIKYNNDMMRPNKLSPEMIALLVVLYKRGFFGNESKPVKPVDEIPVIGNKQEPIERVTVMFLGKRMTGVVTKENATEYFIVLDGETEPRRFLKSAIIKD